VTAPSSGAARRAASRASAAGNRTSLIWEARVDGTHLHCHLAGLAKPVLRMLPRLVSGWALLLFLELRRSGPQC
jgi:hypothetical protein